MNLKVNLRRLAPLVLLTLLSVANAAALEHPEVALSDTTIVSRLGETVDPKVELIDSSGKKFSFAELSGSKVPLVIIPAYYDCPRLCGLVMSGAVKVFNDLKLQMGKEYKVLSVSIDPEESPELAAKRGKEYRGRLEQPGVTDDSWRFLVGEENQVRSLMQTVGFGYKKDGDEFAHSAALFILTPEGKVSQYFTGIEFSAWDMRLALIDASQGGIGSAIDHVLLYCFRFDPTKGKYTLAVLNIIKLGGVMTLAGLGVVFFYATRKSVT